MRETLTALAIVLIVVLTAALAAPYFIDWSAQRVFVEARLSHALGQKVTIGGAIDLKLLPTPYLVLDQAVIGGDDGPITMGIRHLDLELSVAPLLHGEFDVVEARLEEPTIRVTLKRDRSLPPLPDAPAFKVEARFDKIAVIDGTLAIADPSSGRTLALEHLDFEAEVESLSGPFKGSGAAGPAAARTKFRFASTTTQNGKARTKLIIDETPAHAGIDADGTLTFVAGPDGGLRQTFDGTVGIFGHLQDQASDTLLPWRLSGPVHADPAKAVLASGELRIGSEDHGIALAATGQGDFGESPSLQLRLAGKQLDMDRLFGGGAGPGGDLIKPNLPDLAGLRRLFGSAPPPLPLSIETEAETATYGGATLSALSATFTLGGDSALPFKLAADGPGRSHLAVEGRLATRPDTAFRGAASASARDTLELIDWLSIVAPALTPAKQDVPFRSFDAKGQVTISDAGAEGTDLSLRFDRSALTGTARVLRALGERPASLMLDLQAKALDLDGLPNLAALRTQAASTDLDLQLDARGIKVARVADAPLDAGRIRFALTKTGSHFALRDFRIEGLGGATIDATAALDANGGRVDAKLDAADLREASALLKRVAPGGVSDALAARASVLAPAKLIFGAVLKPMDDVGHVSPSASTLTGTFGATKLEASLAPDPGDAKAIVARGSLVAPEGSALLRQMGIASLPLDLLGGSRVSFDAQGPPDGSLKTVLHAALGATTLDLDGQVTLAAGAQRGSGRAKLSSRDVSPLAQSLALAFPDLLGRIPVELSGGVAWTPAVLSFADLEGQVAGIPTSGSLMWQAAAKTEPALTGQVHVDRLSLPFLLGLSLGPAQVPRGDAAWSAVAFGTGLVDPPRSRIGFESATIDLGAGLSGRDAALTLTIAPGLVAVQDAKASLATGHIAGDLTLRRDGPTAAVEGKLLLDDVGLDLPAARGKLFAHVDLAGSGRNALALVASLSGTGDASVVDLLVPRADPGALPKVFDDVEADRLSVDEDSIVRGLEDAAKEPLGAGARRFGVSLAAGVLHLDAPSDAPDPAVPVASTISASADLRKLSLDEKVEQTLQALPKSWSGPPPRIVVTFAGPLKNPSRTMDISAFINALATRALARESARIEAYEFDVHERAFFSQRLQFERRKEQERLKVEDDARQAAEAARKAEAERRAKEAAAKAEKARQAEQARIAQERAAQERERAAQERERAAQDRAARERERAAQERAAQDQERQRALSAPQNDPPGGASRLDQPVAPGPPPDPSSAGRY